MGCNDGAASIKSLQAAESISPVVKLHVAQRERQRILSFYWLLVSVHFLCVPCISVIVRLSLEC